MFNFELMSDRKARESLETRRKRESERQERIFNDKVRTIGVDKEALDVQVKEKKRQEEAAKKEINAYDAGVLQNRKIACILQNRQGKEKREMEKALETYGHQHQQPWNRREFDLNDPDGFRKADPSDAEMMLPGLVGEDQDSESRQLRQREQLREWLIQQQAEQEGEKLQQQREQQQYDQSRIEMDNKAVEHQNLEMERRKAAVIATKEYNLAQIEEKRHQKERDEEESLSQQCALETVGVPGLSPGKDKRVPPVSLQQVIEFQKHQVEEKKRDELEKKREEELYDRVRLVSARTALLIERQQARINKQLRRNQDSINVQLAQIHKQQKPDIERGRVDDSFFSKFNTCSR